ncbi:MAG: polyprenyl synthetase family protein [Candidatus Phaeomarinobacter sp.]
MASEAAAPAVTSGEPQTATSAPVSGAAVDLDSLMASAAVAVTNELDRLIPEVAGPRGPVIAAMRYSALSGGKRLRPFLVMESAGLFGVPAAQSLRVGCAVEMVHCYSLIHDDLPAMDDSDTRRGRPAVHKAFDEAIAILAGDALLTQAFEVLGEFATSRDAAIRAALVVELAKSSGAAGMVGGQMIDISPARESMGFDAIAELEALKTGELIRFSCVSGAVLAGTGEGERMALAGYAADLGLAFQVADDLLDVTGTEEQVGKPVGQDDGLTTFVTLLGLEGARKKAEDLVESACAHLAPFGASADTLRAVARFVVDRNQ